jgi:selenocysteine lyase/cysteine desulfurase
MRALFEIPDDVTYLNCSYMAPQLRSVTAAGLEAVRAKATPWRLSSADFFSGVDVLRALAATVMGVEPDGVAIVPSVSYGLAVAARNAPVRPGQSIAMLEREFPSNEYAWRALARRVGARIVTVGRTGGESWADAIERAVDDDTAVVSVPHCHWSDGSLVDLERVGECARAVGAMFVVDASQSLGAAPLDVARLQPDFLVAVGYKWLLGPYGLGYLYAAPRWRLEGVPLEESWLARAGSEDFSSLTQYRDDYRGGARRFDMGEASQFVLVPMAQQALRAVLAWGVGHIQQTLRPLIDRAAQIAGDSGWIVAPPGQRAGHMVGIRLPTGLPGDLAARLAAERIYVSIRGDSIRVSPHLYNGEADIDRLCSALQR